MINTKLFAAAAILTSMIATPVLAQSMQEPAQKTSQIKKQQMRNSNLRNMRANDRDDRGYQRTDSGFFPVDAAAGIVGGAVATAGAIATAPFGGPSYAYNDGYRTNDGYGYRGGYRNSNASVNDYARVGAFGTAPYTNPVDLNRVGNADPFLGQTYAERNGFVCVPGTVYTNLNGIRTICQ